MFGTAQAPRQDLLEDLRRRMGAVGGRSDFLPASLPGQTTEILDVPEPLVPLLPLGGLPKGAVVGLTGPHGSSTLLLSLLAASAGRWAAVVNMPQLGLAAAAELGVDLDRLAVVPDPGPDLLQVLSVLVDGVDLIAVRPPPGGMPAHGRLRPLLGRIRQRGVVLLVAGTWPGADLTLRTRITAWSGVQGGFGRFRDREIEVQVRGRGAAVRPRTATILLRSSRSRVELVTSSPAVSEQAAPVAAVG